MGQAQLLGRNFDYVGAAYGEVEPLVAHRAMDVDFDPVHEGPALPAVVIGGKRQHAVEKPVT